MFTSAWTSSAQFTLGGVGTLGACEHTVTVNVGWGGVDEGRARSFDCWRGIYSKCMCLHKYILNSK